MPAPSVAVNNAGLMSTGLAEAFPEEQVLHQMNVNFMGSFRDHPRHLHRGTAIVPRLRSVLHEQVRT
jgi:NAD(P)-dependent dehydrogenase (short-subunit alcohol dehydrogenase family)